VSSLRYAVSLNPVADSSFRCAEFVGRVAELVECPAVSRFRVAESGDQAGGFVGRVAVSIYRVTVSRYEDEDFCQRVGEFLCHGAEFGLRVHEACNHETHEIFLPQRNAKPAKN
jgi:hypothetical protein